MANKIFDAALAAEGVSGRLAKLAESIFFQESGGGKNTKTSSAGAVGEMQIIPSTFASVADKGWDIKDPLQNVRAGIRYIKQLDKQSGGNSALTAAGYYGGPGGMEKARKGIAVTDPRNPNAPNTLQYGQQVVARMEGQAPPSRSSPAPAARSLAAPTASVLASYGPAAAPELVAQNLPPVQSEQVVQAPAVQQANYAAAMQQYPEVVAAQQAASPEVNPWDAFRQAMPAVNYAAQLKSYGDMAQPVQQADTSWATGWQGGGLNRAIKAGRVDGFTSGFAPGFMPVHPASA